jgi:3-hydroxyacyl-CoA dehydrogenase/enoyl-CoA hydratase/3-hydroxybutyryl-CoA epimerase
MVIGLFKKLSRKDSATAANNVAIADKSSIFAATMIQYERHNDGIAVFTLNNPDKSANLINRAFAARLNELIATVRTDTQVRGIIITSAKKTFMAGGDLEYLYALRHDAAAVFAEAEQLKSLLRSVETIGKPVVAAINGTALGGGYELALACHYRIALNDPTLRIGLPEVSLGLLPGAGGLTKVVRLLGLQAAFPYLIEGKKANPSTALRDGLIHALATDNDDLMRQAKAWIEQQTRPRQPWDDPDYRLPGGDPRKPQVAQMLAIAPAILAQKTQGNYPAPEAIMNAMVEGAMVDFDTACRIESRYFTRLLTGKVADNMINAFWFQLNVINNGQSRPAGFDRHTAKCVGILGAGMMGAGIAYSLATAGINVVLKDISIEQAERGKQYSAQLLSKIVAKKQKTALEAQSVLDRINTTTQAADLAACDWVIEAVFENRELKAQVTRETEAHLAATALFASNTSTLPISGLAAASARPQQFIGLHFFSPVDKMPLVEIIVGKQTSDDTLAKAFDLVKQMGKTPIVVNDSRGFYTSRVFATYVLEGAAMLGEGIAPTLIEAAGIKAGMPVGPLALLDEVSLSLVFDIREQTRRDIEAEGLTYEAHPAYEVLYKMVRQLNRLGKKIGAGFYDYPAASKKQLWPDLSLHFPIRHNPSHPEAQQQIQRELIDRLLFIQAIETLRCLNENVVRSVADANIGSIFGWGFAPFQGGTLQFIRSYGIDAFRQRAQALAQQYGKRFDVAGLDFGQL